MNILCTFPGKFGDLIWALPTVRAISETYDEPVNLVVSEMMGPIVPLLEQQPYIQQASAFQIWQVRDTAPMTPRKPPTEFNFDRIFHLGYDGWPMLDLPNEIAHIAYKQYDGEGLSLFKGIDLDRPWITVNGPGASCEIAVGFTDEWFELKVGLCQLLQGAKRPILQLAPAGSRWETEIPGCPVLLCSWLQAARAIKHSAMFLGCCSALHVLACAMGKQTVVVEPNPHRHHPIFHPEAVRSRVHLVHGNDGKPTFDARHVGDLVEKVLRHVGMYS